MFETVLRFLKCLSLCDAQGLPFAALQPLPRAAAGRLSLPHLGVLKLPPQRFAAAGFRADVLVLRLHVLKCCYVSFASFLRESDCHQDENVFLILFLIFP